MKESRAIEIQDILGIHKRIQSDDEVHHLGIKGRRYGIEYWEVCEAVWHSARHLLSLGRSEKEV